MVTKAELEAEVELLRDKLRQRDAQERTQEAGGAEPLGPLDAQGITPEAIEAALVRLSGEIARHHQERPMLTLLAAFGSGILLSRILK